MSTPRRIVRTFKPQFAQLVESGAKRQTIRPVPKTMPRPGDIFDARQWTGLPYRSKQRKLGEWPIVRVADVFIAEGWALLDMKPVHEFSALDAFARADGFGSWEQLTHWFRTTHGLPFSGILIQWAPPSVPSVAGSLSRS
jgi:hypothetical protein